MESKRTVWINVTTSSQWNRAVVGVVRVEKELSFGLQRLYPEGCFKRCIWQDGGFVEYIPTALEASPEPPAPVEQAAPVPPAPPLLFPILSRRDAAKSIAQGALSLAPSRSRPAINRLIGFFKGKLARLVYSNRYRQLKQYFQRPHWVRSEVAEVLSKEVFGKELFGKDVVAKTRGSIFNPGDVLLSVGLDWDYPYAQEFIRLRGVESVKIIRCCYDLIPVLYPQYCVADVAAHFTRYFLDVADSADRVLCISKQSERDLKDLLSRAGGRAVPTDVFTLGDNVVEGLADSIGDSVRDIVAEPFILYVPTIERRKNHQVLYQAYHQLCQQGRQEQLPKLVFVGMRGWGVDELFKDIELDPAIKGSIVFANHVNDAELRLLYQQAVCCVFPSLYEGWGLPVAEALAMGKIVLSSDRGSLTEVGGELVTYIDPWHPAQWAEEIWRVATDPAYHKALSAKVASGYAPRQWCDTAAAVKSIIDELLTPDAIVQTYYCAYDLKPGIGQRVGPLIVSRGEKGLLFEGPRKALVPGHYRLQLWDRPADRKSGSCSLHILADGRELAALQKLDFNTAGDSQPLLSIEFEMPSAARCFDVRCELISGELSVEKLLLVSR